MSFLPHQCHSFRITVIPSVLLSFLPDHCHSFRIIVIPSILVSFLPNIVIPSVLLSFLPDHCHSFRISVIPSELLPFQIFFNPEQLQKGEKMVTRGGLLNLKKFLIRLHPTKKVCRISIMNSFSLHRKVKGSDLVHFLENGKTFSDKATFNATQVFSKSLVFDLQL